MADAEIRLADQVANGTMSQEIADLLRDTATAHKSFIVMAVPRLAGKTTTMRAMLAEQRGPVVTLGYDGDVVSSLIPRAKNGYLVVPELSRVEHSPGYVWGDRVRQAFAGISSGTALATAVHAPNPEEAFKIICGGCGVPDVDAARITLVVYIRSLGEWEQPTRRVVSAVHEIRGVTAGRPDTRLLFSWNEAKDRFERGGVSADLRDHFARKATAVGAVVTRAADVRSARDAVGREAGDESAIGLFAIAETGSVAVSLPRAERGRCLLAERLWLFVPADDLAPTLDAALQRIAALVVSGRGYVTLMTGPSRTADIERALTVGVHGPRELHVILVDGPLS